MGPSVFGLMKRPREAVANGEDSEVQHLDQKAAACKHTPLLCENRFSKLDLDEDLTWDGEKKCPHCKTLIPMVDLPHCAEECSSEECADHKGRFAQFAGAYASASAIETARGVRIAECERVIAPLLTGLDSNEVEHIKKILATVIADRKSLIPILTSLFDKMKSGNLNASHILAAVKKL